MTPRPATEDGEEGRCPWHDTLVESLGRSGNNGRLGNAEESIEGLQGDMAKVKAEQTKMSIKLAAITGSASLIGGGVVAVLTKVLG
jgi:hypothetical protein